MTSQNATEQILTAVRSSSDNAITQLTTELIKQHLAGVRLMAQILPSEVVNSLTGLSSKRENDELYLENIKLKEINENLRNRMQSVQDMNAFSNSGRLALRAAELEVENDELKAKLTALKCELATVVARTPVYDKQKTAYRLDVNESVIIQMYNDNNEISTIAEKFGMSYGGIRSRLIKAGVYRHNDAPGRPNKNNLNSNLNSKNSNSNYLQITIDGPDHNVFI